MKCARRIDVDYSDSCRGRAKEHPSCTCCSDGNEEQRWKCEAQTVPVGWNPKNCAEPDRKCGDSEEGKQNKCEDALMEEARDVFKQYAFPYSQQMRSNAPEN